MRSSSVFCVGWRNIEEANTADRYAGLVIFHRTWHDNSIVLQIQKFAFWRKEYDRFG